MNNDSGGGLVTSRASGCYTANSSSSDSHDLKDEKEEETTATEEGKKDGSSRVLSSPPLDSSNNDEIVCFVKRFDINVDSSSFLADRRLDKILKRYMKQNSLCHIAAVGTEWVNDDLINIFISVMTLLLYPKDKNSLLFPTTFLNEFETQKKDWNHQTWLSSLLKNVEKIRREQCHTDKKLEDRKWFLPYCLNENHWVLVVVQLKQKIIEIYDYLKSQNKTLPKRIETFVQAISC